MCRQYFWHKYLFVGLICIILVAILGLVACNKSTSDYMPTSSTTIDEPASKITQAQAYIMVVGRLTELAQTPEAKEYVTIFFIDSVSWREYDEGLGAWGIGISPGPQGYNLIREADWFNVADEDYFFDLHWDEPRPTWAVYDDGRIMPLGKALMVEDDIQQLNTAKALE